MTEDSNQEPKAEDDSSRDGAAQLAAETLGRDMLEALLDELKAAPDCWQKMNQNQQDQCIERLRRRTQQLISNALAILFRGDYPSCRAVIDAVQFKDGIKAVLKIGKTEHARHELADAVGQAVVVVMSSPDEYFGRMEEVRAKAAQADLFDSDRDPGVSIGETYTGGDPKPYRRDENTPPDFDPDAPAPDLTIDRGPLWQQAKEVLESIGITVTDEIAQTWTDEQCGMAAYWASEYAKDRQTKLPRPAFIPSPDTDAAA